MIIDYYKDIFDELIENFRTVHNLKESCDLCIHKSMDIVELADHYEKYSIRFDDFKTFCIGSVIPIQVKGNATNIFTAWLNTLMAYDWNKFKLTGYGKLNKTKRILSKIESINKDIDSGIVSFSKRNFEHMFCYYEPLGYQGMNKFNRKEKNPYIPIFAREESKLDLYNQLEVFNKVRQTNFSIIDNRVTFASLHNTVKFGNGGYA